MTDQRRLHAIDGKPPEPPPMLNYAVEQALLGGLMARNLAWHEIATICRPEHFADALHGRIFAAIGRQVSEGRKVDVLTLKGEFDRDPALMPFTAPAYLGQLAAAVVTVTNLEDYAAEIRNLWLRRELIELNNRTIAALQDFDREPDEIMADDAVMRDSLMADGRDSTSSAQDVASRMVEDLKNPPPCASTGIGGLDEIMGGGLYPGKLYGVSGRKKAGKSALLTTISYNLGFAPEPVPHLYVCLEMSPGQLELRNAARFSGLNSMAFLNRPNRFAIEQAASYAASASSARLYEHRPGATLRQLGEMIGRAKITRRIKGVIVDYWQLVSGKGHGETREEHQANVAQWCADAAGKLGIWFLVGCQLNQEGNTRGGEGLRLACDMLLAINRDPDSERAWLDMQESRYTPYANLGSDLEVGLWFHKNGTYFDETPPPLVTPEMMVLS